MDKHLGFCRNCKFSHTYNYELIPKPTGKTFLGFPKELSEADKILNEIYEDRNENYRECRRFPKSVRVHKYYGCGEYIDSNL